LIPNGFIIYNLFRGIGKKKIRKDKNLKEKKWSGEKSSRIALGQIFDKRNCYAVGIFYFIQGTHIHQIINQGIMDTRQRHVIHNMNYDSK